VSPAPNAQKTTSFPREESSTPLRTASSKAIGIEAADVLPYFSMLT